MSTSLTPKYPFLDPPLDATDLGSLGPYRVISELGRGGMGFVFRAEDTRLKRVVALKMMNQKIASTANSRRRFIEEARSMAAVKHDNVATIYEVNDQFSTPFMAMELLKGVTLEEKSRIVKQLDYQTVIRFATEIARGLAAAHAQGIVHRDIKPANIWIEADTDRIKILDFGLALANVPVDQIAARGSVIGTPQYLSPEQASSELLDDRTDLYSLGVVLFELCTGQLPFRVKSVAEQLLATLVHKPPRVNKINPQIPEPLAELIGKLLEKEPRRRPRSAAELEKLLNKVAVECEAKSDVALAINKLQAQLSSVVTKQPDPFTASSITTAPGSILSELGENAFDQLPLPAAVIAVPTTIGKPGSVKTVRPSTSFAKPVSSSASKQLEKSLLAYWPISAIGATAAVLMAIVGGVWYGTMSASTRVANTIVYPVPNAPVNAQVQTPPPTNTVPKVTKQPSSESAQLPTGPGDRLSEMNGENPSPISTPIQDQAFSGKDRNKTDNRDSSPSVDSTDDPPAEENREPSASLNDEASDPRREPPSFSQRSKEEMPKPSSVIKPATENAFEKLSRTTSDGRGADTTIKRGGSKSDPLGEDKSVAVQTRGPVDVQHSYLRFDIKGLVSNKQKPVGAELVLSLPGVALPAGSRLRVYGVPEDARDDWAETGPRALSWSNSLSNKPLEVDILLAEITFSGEESSAELRVRDDRLTTFVQGIKEEFVTLILAGGSPDNKPLYFVSRDGDSTKAPSLLIEVADSKN